METIYKKKPNLMLSIIQEKCPHCGQSHVFKKGTKLFEIPVMYEKCTNCNYKFDREPGYFFGAMYVSYGIAVFFGILTFLIFNVIFPSFPVEFSLVAIATVILLIAKKNYKLSRIIFIHLFPW
jgi:uncharacterized protein (DUF983 family)